MRDIHQNPGRHRHPVWQVCLLLPLLLVACSPHERIEEFTGPTMGSLYTIKYVRTAGTAGAARLKQETEAILARLDRNLSTYRPDSAITRFNQLPAGQCAEMPEDVRHLVAAGAGLSARTGGALDLTVKSLLDVWGFGPAGRVAQPPDAAQIAAARARTGYQHLRIEGGQLCKDADVQVDFNSIAAGYAVDLVSARLAELGAASHLVEITGELRAQGRKPDGSSWRVAIEAPLENQRVPQEIVALDGWSTSTSGDYRNYFERDGQRYSHTLDPRTGRPVTHRLAAVTVIVPSALQADGLSTALMVMGPEQGLAFARQQQLAALFVIHDGQGFVTRKTGVFDQRFASGARP